MKAEVDLEDVHSLINLVYEVITYSEMDQEDREYGQALLQRLIDAVPAEYKDIKVEGQIQTEFDFAQNA